MATTSMTAGVLQALLDPLRRTPLSTADQVLLACQVAAWCAIGGTGVLPLELRPTETPLSRDHLSFVFERLQRLDSLKGDEAAFQQAGSALNAIPEDALGALQIIAQRLARQDAIGPALYAEALSSAQGPYGLNGGQSLPQELVGLMVGLADGKAGQSVYVPYDALLQLSLAAAQAGTKPHAELRSPQPLAHLGNLLAGQPAEVRVSDPLRRPGYTSSGDLLQFDSCISFPPLGEKVQLEFVDRDPYRRFPERTAAGHVLAVRHVMAQTEGRAVILTANSLLFGAGAERSLRQDLVDGRLKTVIALPPATLYGTNIPLTILVLDGRTAPSSPEVLFVDGSEARFHRRDGRGRTKLEGWKDLLRVAQTGDDTVAARVPRDQVAANDYQLTVARYVRSPELDAVDAVLRNSEVKALEDLVEFIRPVPVLPTGDTTENAVEVPEVGTADLRDHDYIQPSRKTVRLTAVKNTLEPLDIIITIKGSAGKVGLVPPALPEHWVAGQTCLVLRLRDRQDTGHTARSLFMYLRSPLGKACLQRIVSGAAVPLIQLKELRRLPVPVLTLQQAHEVDQMLEDMVALQRQIQALQEEIGQRCWPLPTGEPAT